MGRGGRKKSLRKSEMVVYQQFYKNDASNIPYPPVHEDVLLLMEELKKVSGIERNYTGIVAQLRKFKKTGFYYTFDDTTKPRLIDQKLKAELIQERSINVELRQIIDHAELGLRDLLDEVQTMREKLNKKEAER